MSEGSKKAQKRIANLMRRVSTYRTRPISDHEAKDPIKMHDMHHREGMIHGLSLALAIIIECEK